MDRNMKHNGGCSCGAENTDSFITDTPTSPISSNAEATANIQKHCFQELERCNSGPPRCNCRECNQNCNGIPIAVESSSRMVYEKCCDRTGCCGLYPACCRNPFWPDFSRPTWLCCHDLYN